ncbi:MAG: hypothetical protein IT306_07950 [Chloroflexi bacterium]|nr:hypothetical protein [Chloroflexota bacterium]
MFGISEVTQSACRPVTRLVAATLISLSLGVLTLATPASAATFTVTTAADNGDDMAPIAHSLRAAIVNANNTPGADTIQFAIGTVGSARSIEPSAPLPALTEQVLIDGWTQGTGGYSGPPLIEITGTSAGSGNGLVFAGSNIEVRGLIVDNFQGAGIVINQPNSKVIGSYIGTNATGTGAAPNGSHGIAVESIGAVIGGTSASDRNVISGNGEKGIDVCSCASVSIQGNYIGTDATGMVAVGNAQQGIFVNNVSNITIGGTTASARNVISGNGSAGITLSGSSVTNAAITGNYIGTDKNGITAIPNSGGVEITGTGSNVTVGGTTAGAGNLISGNSGHGVSIAYNSGTGTTVTGNYIGTNVTGLAAIANTAAGVALTDSVNVTVGGTSASARNILSGNGLAGVMVAGVSTSNAVIAGNYVGTDPGGIASVPNQMGVLVLDTSSVTIGGTAAGSGNLISGNTFEGIIVNTVPTSGTLIQGNYIGTDATGTGALGNYAGIALLDTVGVTVGGASASARNVISGNGIAGGVITYGSSAANTTIAGNYIGTSADGTFMIPNLYGVAIQEGTGHLVGGTATGAGNLIVGNDTTGVQVTTGAQAAILGNLIYANAGLGIDLGDDGVTANDVNDGDSGPNGLQNFPVVGSATTQNGTSRVTVTLNSTASQTYTVELYSSPSCDISGNGEGQVFLGRFSLVTDGAQNGALVTTVPTLTVGHVVTATATSPGNQTSEFSLCRSVVTPAVTATPSGGTTATTEGGATDTYTVVLTSQPTANVTVTMAGSVTGLVSFAPSTTLTFTPANWNTPQTVTITSVEDQIYNQSSYSIGFTVASSDAVYNAMPVSSLAATHTDNESVPSISIADASFAEPSSGSTVQNFTVTMSPASGSVVTAQYAASNGTATGGGACGTGVDFVTSSGTLTLQAGETSKTLPVTVCADAVAESAETMTMTLSSPVGATIGRAAATGAIANTTNGSITIADASVAEGNSGVTVATFNLTLSGPSAQATSVDYTTANGTALAGQDYQAATGTVTFQAGETTKSIAINVLTDTVVESDETFTVTLSNPTNGATLARAQATGTIQNDDAVQPCSPRPAIRVQTSVYGGALRATITSTPLNTNAANPIASIRLGTLQNARVTLNGQVLGSGQTVTLPANTVAFELVVTRVAAGQTTTVPLTVVDGCGEWQTMVGGGAGAGF